MMRAPSHSHAARLSRRLASLLRIALAVTLGAACMPSLSGRQTVVQAASLPDTSARASQGHVLVPAESGGLPLGTGGDWALDGPTVTPAATPADQLAALMQQMEAAWNATNWPEVLLLLDQISAIDPNYDNIPERRYLAYVNYGYQLLTEGRCTESLAAFRTAHDLRPDGQEALQGLDLISRYCGTPVPTTPGAPTPWPGLTITPAPGPATATPTPRIVTTPITYVVQPGDTLYRLALNFGTTVQAIMQANGMMTYFIRAGDVIWIPASGSPPPGPIVHIVQPGETLFSIARQYNTTVWAIMAANGLRGYYIWAYRALFIPTVLQPGPVVVVVMPGQTLFAIAQQHGTTVAMLMLANGLRGYDIYPYQRLVIPPVGWNGWPPIVPGVPSAPGPGVGPAPGPAPGPVPPPPAMRTYVVQPGDTLYSISRRFGVTVNALMAANGLTSSMIRSGQVLLIP